jgi:AcrR family transcriptional regulator
MLDAAVELLEHAPMTGLTVRAVAERAGISERTVFRYFTTRDEMLDAVAKELARRIDLPAEPKSIDELLGYPAALYSRFEATAALTKAALHSELFHRMRSTQAQRRWAAVEKLLDRAAPKRAECERKIAAANIRYYLTATTWHYYRFYFCFSLQDSIQCAATAIAQALEALCVRCPAHHGAAKRR